MTILTTQNKNNEKYLRKKVPVLDLRAESKKELKNTVKEMRIAMKKANGIGLSANQVGVSKRLFVAEAPKNDKGDFYPFYAIINPVLTKISEETSIMEEGCLSIPEIYGAVERPEKIILEGLDVNGKKIKIRAWGLLARVFQHELDHLDGILFIDKATNVHRVQQTDID